MMYSLASFSNSDMTECASELRKLGVEALSIGPSNSSKSFMWQRPRQPVVPAQEKCLIPFGIEWALGCGGVLPSKEFFTVILFSRQGISRETAELFNPLALSVKLALLLFDGSGSIRSLN
jgi:hypothetical protein